MLGFPYIILEEEAFGALSLHHHALLFQNRANVPETCQTPLEAQRLRYYGCSVKRVMQDIDRKPIHVRSFNPTTATFCPYSKYNQLTVDDWTRPSSADKQLFVRRAQADQSEAI